jgi:hypothetical protein
MAASEGNLALLQSSVSSLNLPLTAADENGYTLLHAAASYNQLEVLRFLLNNVTDPQFIHAGDNEGDTALHYAGNIDAAQLLVQVGKCNPSQANRQGKTALQTKQEELDEMMQDEDADEDDEDMEILKHLVAYLSSLS